MAHALVWIAVFAAIAGVSREAHADPGGFYARNASAIWDKIAGAPPAIKLKLVSPDGKSHVLAHNDPDKGVVLEVGGRIGSHDVDLGAGVGSELLWSPNSEAFAVTTSDDGANGHYRTIVVISHPGGAITKDLSPLVEAVFGHPVRCGWPEDPNVGAVHWVDSAKLVVAAEIVAHSNCDSFGTFRAYEIDLERMRVTRSFDQIAAKHIFGPALGLELRNAPDECVRSPRRCWVSTNHPSEASHD
jgi:hypothetical protein